jgi:hypothetical protein
LNLGQRFVLAAAPKAIPIGDESVIKNCVNPAAQVSFASPLLPAGKGALEAVLQQIIGGLSIAVEQCAGKPAQSRDMLFEEFGLVQGGLADGQRAAARSMPKGEHS